MGYKGSSCIFITVKGLVSTPTKIANSRLFGPWKNAAVARFWVQYSRHHLLHDLSKDDTIVALKQASEDRKDGEREERCQKPVKQQKTTDDCKNTDSKKNK